MDLGWPVIIGVLVLLLWGWDTFSRALRRAESTLLEYRVREFDAKLMDLDRETVRSLLPANYRGIRNDLIPAIKAYRERAGAPFEVAVRAVELFATRTAEARRA